MKKIIEEKKQELVINKSKFIGLIYCVYNYDEVNNIINNLKKEYKDATHICYAYIIDEVIKYNDDKEPIAGLPILNVLKSNDLNYVLCVVVRYFGGIKLGVGGLNRAYSDSCKMCVINNTKTIEEGFKVTIKFKYDYINQIDFMFKNGKIIDKVFDEFITYTILINKKEYQQFENNLKNICQIIDIQNYII